MAAPREITMTGAPRGFNGKIVHATLGTLYVMVERITRNVSINTAQDSASQAKTMYPLWVSQGGTVLHLVHRSHAERDKVNRWVERFQERSSSAMLDHNYVDVSVPNRRFQRRAMIQGTLIWGEDVSDVLLRTSLTLVGAADPVQRYTDRSRVKLSTTDYVSTYFYPSGNQVGWDTAEEVYDVPPIRPGQPNRPV